MGPYSLPARILGNPKITQPKIKAPPWQGAPADLLGVLRQSRRAISVKEPAQFEPVTPRQRALDNRKGVPFRVQFFQIVFLKKGTQTLRNSCRRLFRLGLDCHSLI